MPRLVQAATKIPEEWDDRIQQLTERTGLTRAEILRQAIGQYLRVDTDTPVIPVNQDCVSRAEFEALAARITKLEGIPRLTKPAATPRPKTEDSIAPSQDAKLDCPKCGEQGSLKHRAKLAPRADGTPRNKYRCLKCGEHTTI